MGLAMRVVLACAAVLAMGSPVAARATTPTTAAPVRLAAATTSRPAVAQAPTVASAARRCSAGLVALTFDDGPARGLTAKLVGILRDHDVPATFFMVGSRVRTAPKAARLVARAGFTIGNHTWSHAHLTRLPDGAVRRELRSTARELRRNGIPRSTLMRPPYGDVNSRIRRDVARLDLVPVLWNVDSGDWRGGSSRQIAASVLRQLRPHRSNIVLQHDGVRNSPASVAAVPRVIRAAQRRGYCFARLGPHGHMEVPVPTVQGTVAAGSESGPVPARVLVQLSRPTSREVSLRVRGTSGTATAGEDFVAPLLRVSFPVGTTRAWVDVPVIDDAAYEPTEDFHVVFDSPFGVVITRADQIGTITSDDAGP
jgi:peptidoglycan/xylan/chitin deacetylase (PgdA/CDA1 family)